jgi:hypothetical protein
MQSVAWDSASKLHQKKTSRSPPGGHNDLKLLQLKQAQGGRVCHTKVKSSSTGTSMQRAITT